MAGFADIFVNYGLETEWLLTWFPVKDGAAVDVPKMSGGVFRHRITDFDSPGIGGGVEEVHILPIPFTKGTNIAAFITIGIDSSYIYHAELEVSLGTNRRKKYYQLKPGTTTAFMVNVAAGGNNREISNTSVVLQGVFSAGDRASVASIVVSGLFGGLSPFKA